MNIEINYMKMALDLASEVKGSTFPNPAVGAVVVKDGKVIGCGATKPAGSDHAEIVALKEAGKSSKGADLYVTLEPCSHFGKTPPCTDAIIKAGIKNVFVAIEDPNPLVSGQGMAALRNAEITVIPDILKNDAAELNEEFFFSINSKLAWVTIKLALTLDGAIADSNNTSKWITSAESRKLVHKFRAEHAAIAVGKKTYLHDNPKLDVRGVSGNSPARILFMNESDLLHHSNFYNNVNEVRSIIASPGGNKGEILKRPDNIEVWSLGNGNMGEQIKLFRQLAYKEGLTSVLIEGGAGLAASFIENDHVNKLLIFYGNKIIGGGVKGFNFKRPLSLQSSLKLKNIKMDSVGENIFVQGYPYREELCLQD